MVENNEVEKNLIHSTETLSQIFLAFFVTRRIIKNFENVLKMLEVIFAKERKKERTPEIYHRNNMM